MNQAAIKQLGTLSLINFASKHAEKLNQFPDESLRAHGARVLGETDKLRNAYAARRPLRALWVDATRAKDDKDDALDDLVRTVSYDLLAPALLNKNRKAPEYRVLFPDGTIAFIDGSDREEIAHVHGMVAYLRATPTHPMAGRAEALHEKVVALEEALGPQARAEQALRAAEVLEREARDGLHRCLRKSVTFLRDHFDGTESKVDSLFPSIAEAKVKEEEPE